MIDVPRLEGRLQTLKLNPYSAAKLAGLGPDYIRDIIRGKVKEPSGYKLARLAEALHCSTSYLLGEETSTGIPPSALNAEYQPRVSHLPIQHRLAKNVYRPVEDEAEPLYGISTPVFDFMEYAGWIQWLALIEDDHALPLIPRLHLVHVLDSANSDFSISSRDVVVIERYSSDKKLVERTLGRVMMPWPGGWAVRPIPNLGENVDDIMDFRAEGFAVKDGSARLVGRVFMSFRPLDNVLKLHDLSAPFGVWPE